MSLMPASLAFALALACAGLMGFAIQRGGTCTVAAVEELVSQGRATRLRAMAEASLWVAGGLVVARALGLLPALPTGHAITAYTVVGGVLLGLGAWLNGACVFGAVARLGSGEWAYAATPLGFYLGCLLLPRWMPLPPASTSIATAGAMAATPPAMSAMSAMSASQMPLLPSPEHAASTALLAAALLVAVLALWRAQRLARTLWTPHAATVVIGLAFTVLLVVGGAWAYTDVLAELARGMAGGLPARTLLVLALFLGALLGGFTAGRLRATAPSVATLARCLAGGALMAWGTLLIPGANDGLILVGMPLLQPHAWLAFGTMALSIAAALALVRALGALRARRTAP